MCNFSCKITILQGRGGVQVQIYIMGSRLPGFKGNTQLTGCGVPSLVMSYRRMWLCFARWQLAKFGLLCVVQVDGPPYVPALGRTMTSVCVLQPQSLFRFFQVRASGKGEGKGGGGGGGGGGRGFYSGESQGQFCVAEGCQIIINEGSTRTFALCGRTSSTHYDPGCSPYIIMSSVVQV